LIKSQVLYQLS